MADAAVEFLLNNLKDLLLYHSHLITDTKKQIESLESDLRILDGFLKSSTTDPEKNELTEAQDRKVRNVVYEVEDVIDTFVTRVMEKNSMSSYSLKFWKYYADLHEVGQKVDKVKERVNQAKNDLVNFRVVDDKHKSAKPDQDRLPRQIDVEHVVGFEDVTEELINRLTKETDYFDVVCLIGTFGMGKTTLAWKVFNDQEISNRFPVRIWLLNHQKFSDQEIFLDMLENFTSVTDDIRNKKDKEIAQILAGYLKSQTFLIVMDDVWTHDDWDRLEYVLPTTNNKGKVLITSRIEEVGKYACRPRLPHHLRPFNQEESWKLLQLEALRKVECHPALVNVGKLIASACDGLPIAIVIIGGILARKYSPADISATRKAWEEVSTHVSAYLNMEDRMKRFISLSFDKLPCHLRTCFIYLGTMFPEDYEIPASKLILMWIGEGFIQHIDDYSLEEIGEKYLEDLINRSMVRIEKIKTNGKVKTCRILDVLREFCRTRAGTEYFFQDIKSIDNVHNLTNCRRLSVHSNCSSFISSKPCAPLVRSFVCFSNYEYILPLENIPHILKAFKLVRVLDVKPIKFPKVNSDLFQLVHVRYITLSFDLSTLPSKFSQLLNLQTLIVDTSSKTLKVEADIWKLIHLRLFKTNVSATLPNPSKDSKGKELQTLGTISVKSCTDKIFEQASNLKKLAIRGQLALLLEGKEGSFDSLGRMDNLENLKLINDLHPRPPSEGQLKGLPQLYQFPSRLKSLTLRATFLDWSNMSILGLMMKLEVLKLKDKAFMGKIWVADDGGFPSLEFLHIEDTNLVVWAASSHHYPKLRGLVLRNCGKLLEVPIGLADIETFQALQLYSCKSAVISAKRIHEAKKNHPPFSLIMNEQS